MIIDIKLLYYKHYDSCRGEGIRTLLLLLMEGEAVKEIVILSITIHLNGSLKTALVIFYESD